MHQGGPQPRVPTTEFAIRLAEQIGKELKTTPGRWVPVSSSVSLELLDTMETPELVDLFCALSVDAATRAWAATPGKPWVPFVLDSPLAAQVLMYAYWGDVPAITAAVKNAPADKRKYAAGWLAVNAARPPHQV